jgi:hypothetical protein
MEVKMAGAGGAVIAFFISYARAVKGKTKIVLLAETGGN